jgi:hypothetical protein
MEITTTPEFQQYVDLLLTLVGWGVVIGIVVGIVVAFVRIGWTLFYWGAIAAFVLFTLDFLNII